MTDEEKAAQVLEGLAEDVRRGEVHPSVVDRKVGEKLREAMPEALNSGPRPALTFAEASALAIAAVTRRVNRDEAPIPLPFPELAEQFGGGLWPGLHFVTSTTGTGKTALALQIARKAANAGSTVLYVPLELEPAQLAIRMIADTLWEEWRAKGKPQGEAPPSWSDAYEGRMSDTPGTPEGHANMFNNVWRERFAAVRVDRFHVIDAQPGKWDAMTLGDELDRVLPPGEGTPKHPPLIVVDFLQLVGQLNGPESRQDPRERVGLVSYHLRDLARKRGAAVLVISSTARSNYGAFYGEKSKGSGDPHVRFNNGNVRTIDRAYLLEGTGKESGEVEYAADTVSALLRTPDGQSIFATAKGRSRGPNRHQWCALEFEHGRFVAGDAGAAAASWAGEDATEASADDKASGKGSGKGSKSDAGTRTTTAQHALDLAKGRA